MKHILFIIALGIILCGILVITIYNDAVTEVIFGLAAPMIMAIVSVIWHENVHKNSPEKLTNTLIKSFIIRMIVFALYFIIFFAFYSFEPIPFIVSFTGFFTSFYIVEAAFLKKLIQ